MRALIIANGEDVESCHEYVRTPDGSNSFDLCIVADGAAHRISHQVCPQVICGDFDSIDRERATNNFPDVEFIHLPDQERSDIEKAIDVAISRGATDITLAGCFGNRIDHSMAALSTMIAYHVKLPVCAWYNGSCSWVLSDVGEYYLPLSFDAEPQQTISILPLGQSAVVTAQNLAWPLETATVHAGSRGVSNRAIGGTVTITCHSGCLVVCRMP